MSIIRSHYKGLLSLSGGIVLAIYLSHTQILPLILLHLGPFSSIGAFVAGLLFVSTFTVATAVLMLILLTSSLSPLTLSVCAACGATVGNYLIFLYIKKHIIHPIGALKNRKGKKNPHAQLGQFGHLLLPFLGVLIIASPLPDELGILLLSIYKMKNYQFIFISFLLKLTGIYLLVSNI